MPQDGRYDISYTQYGMSIVPHFCREYGCYGTNKTHGMTYEEAMKYIINQAKLGYRE
jgi:hypothetical protein